MEETKDSGDPQPVKLTRHRGLDAKPPLPGPQNQSTAKCEKDAGPLRVTEQIHPGVLCCFIN